MLRSGLGTVARAWIVPLLRFTALSMKSSVPCRSKCAVAVEADGNVVMRFAGPVMGLLIGEVIRLAHIEVEIDRIERNDGRQQRGRAGAAPAAADEAADGDEMRADSPGERRGYPRIFQVELSIRDRGLGGFDGGLRAALVGGALVHALRRAEIGALELLRPPKLQPRSAPLSPARSATARRPARARSGRAAGR